MSPSSWNSFIARETVSRLAPIIWAMVWCVSGLSIAAVRTRGEIEQQAGDAPGTSSSTSRRSSGRRDAAGATAR
jgi:hypothetical protein